MQLYCRYVVTQHVATLLFSCMKTPAINSPFLSHTITYSHWHTPPSPSPLSCRITYTCSHSCLIVNLLLSFCPCVLDRQYRLIQAYVHFVCLLSCSYMNYWELFIINLITSCYEKGKLIVYGQVRNQNMRPVLLSVMVCVRRERACLFLCSFSLLVFFSF